MPDIPWLPILLVVAVVVAVTAQVVRERRNRLSPEEQVEQLALRVEQDQSLSRAMATSRPTAPQASGCEIAPSMMRDGWRWATRPAETSSGRLATPLGSSN